MSLMFKFLIILCITFLSRGLIFFLYRDHTGSAIRLTLWTIIGGFIGYNTPTLLNVPLKYQTIGNFTFPFLWCAMISL